MKKMLTYIAAGLLALGAQTLLADDATNSAPAGQTETTTPGAKLRDMTPDQRKAYIEAHPELAKQARERKEVMKRLGLSREDLKGLSPEERHAKIKEAADKAVADLQQKKANGALTAQEQADLDYIQTHLEKAHKHAKPSDT